MKNPLAVFTGAALATLAALAGLNMTNWPGGAPDAQKPAEAAGPAQEPAETAGATEKPAATAGASEKPAETAGATQKPAAEEAAPSAEKPTEMAAIPAQEPPKAETGTAAAQPELDTVRVESDGQAIVAGRAKPGAEIALKLGNEVIGKGIANTDGSWVVVPDQPLPKGAHEITIEQKAADSAPVTAEQSIAVAVPEKPGQQAMVALTEPGTATKVLQAGGNQEQASLSEPEAEAAAGQPTAPAAAETPAEPAQGQHPPNADEPAGTAETPAEGAKPEEQAEKPAGQTTDVAKTEVFPEAVKPPEPTAPAAPAPAKATGNIPLRLDAVDYNDKGDIIFSGRARPGTAVRLYVDNRPVGDAIVDTQGNWSFAGKDIIAPGTHNLRADQIDKAGKVIARIELPFLRENAEAVAELNSKPEPQEVEAEEPEQTSEPQPTAEQPQTTTAEQPQTTTAEQPQTTTAEQPKATAAAQPAPETSAPSAQASAPEKTTEPPQITAAPQQPEASPPKPAKTAEAEPPQPAEVQKAAPQAPAPDQPVAGVKAPEVTTTAAAEQAAKAIDPDQPRSGKVVIQPGNNLWKLSRVIYGRGKNYTVIYQANKEQIRNPARIYPGQIFAIPGASPPEQIDPKRKDPLSSAEGGAAQ